MSVHEQPNGKWYVSFRDATGKQRTKTFPAGKEGKKEAQAFDLEIKFQKKLGNEPQPRSKLYFDQLAQMYLDDRKLHGASQSFVETLKILMNGGKDPDAPSKGRWLEFLCKKPVAEFTYPDMVEFGQRYQDRSQATRNRYLSYLKTIFAWGLRHDLLKDNPLKNWHPSKEAPRRSQLTVDDLKKIMAVAPEHLKWAIEVEFNLGTRPGASELLSLKWSDIDFDKGVVNVYATKTKDWREIPISKEFRTKLLVMKQTAQTDHVVEYRGRAIKSLCRSFSTACKKAGIPYECEMYDCRHLFASLLLSGGADLAAVSKLLGHSSTQQTADTYYELLKGEKERAIALLPSLSDSSEENEKASKVVPFKASR